MSYCLYTGTEWLHNNMKNQLVKGESFGMYAAGATQARCLPWGSTQFLLGNCYRCGYSPSAAFFKSRNFSSQKAAYCSSQASTCESGSASS